MARELRLRMEDIGGWRIPVVGFSESTMMVELRVKGTIINSITEKKADQKAWKRCVTSKVKAARGIGPWNPNQEYCVSLGMKFNARNHGNRPDLDVENFIKPVLDAVAAGLFCEEGINPDDIERWDFDDSNFRTLFIRRLPDAPRREMEGVAIYVSVI